MKRQTRQTPQARQSPKAESQKIIRQGESEERALPVAVVGRPNAGKSTLLNALAGCRASIVSPKRQTTRAVVRARFQCGGLAAVWEDTPGWQARYVDTFSRTLNAGAEQSAAAASVVVYVVAALDWHVEDVQLLLRLPPQCRIIIAVNKTDLLAKRDMLLPFFADINAVCQKHSVSPRAIVPVSALRKRGLQPLLDEVAKAMTETANAGFATAADNHQSESINKGGGVIDNNVANHKTADRINDDDADFSYAEILREKLFMQLGGELPYRAAVIARTMPRRGKTLRITADVYVEKESQKAIVIGAGGAALKKTATAARRRMEQLAGEKIFLTVRVRARKWRQDNRLLSQMRIGT